MKNTSTSLALFIADESTMTAFGLSPSQRLAKQATRLGFFICDDPDQADVILSGQYVYGNAVLGALGRAAPGTWLIDTDGRAVGARLDAGTGQDAAQTIQMGKTVSGPHAKTGLALAGRYDAVLRKRADPMVMRANDQDAVERALFRASYKGVTDFVTKHIWPRPALAVTRWCAQNRITPNMVTWFSVLLMFLAMWLFWIGAFLPGLAVGWVMTFLDTVDGKLARVTLSSSRMGDVLDHGVDLIHPPFWWWAWAQGCAGIGLGLDNGGLVLGIIIAGYILQRIEEGIFIYAHGFHMHSWRRIDSLFRQITARRNPNLAILSIAAIFGAPWEGLVLVAVWTLVCLIFHLVQIIQAHSAARKGPIQSWLATE